MTGLQNDLGGADNLTVAEQQITQHAAVLGAIIEHHEALWISGEDVNVNEVLASVNCQRRLLTELGLQRRAKDVTPNLRQYLEGKVQEQGGGGGQQGPGAGSYTSGNSCEDLRDNRLFADVDSFKPNRANQRYLCPASPPARDQGRGGRGLQGLGRNIPAATFAQ